MAHIDHNFQIVAEIDLCYLGMHTGTLVPIGTDIRFEKNRYLPVSLRTGTKRHRFVFEYRFVSTD